MRALAIYGNSAYRGGGLIVYRGSLKLTNGAVIQNTSTNGAAAITALIAFVSISNSTVSGNTTYDDSAGGIYNIDGIVYLDDSTVANNYAPWSGGGIHADATRLRISNSTISGNAAAYDGGEVVGIDEPIVIRNSTVAGNDAANYGGGSLGVTTSLYLANTIVAGNDAPAGGANCMSSDTTSFGYNLADDSSCGLTATGDLVVADAMLGPLQDNGGPTQTHDLLPGSPAIDAGGSSCSPPAADQRGVVRPQGVACDIGAVESLAEPHHAVSMLAGSICVALLFRRRARIARFAQLQRDSELPPALRSGAPSASTGRGPGCGAPR